MYDIELEPEPIRRILNYHKLFEILKVSVDLGIYTQITTPFDRAASITVARN